MAKKTCRFSFKEAVPKGILPQVLNRAVQDLSELRQRNPAFLPDALATVAPMLAAANSVANIGAFLPVDPNDVSLAGYAAWLARLPSDPTDDPSSVPFTVAVDANVWEEMHSDLATEAGRHRLVSRTLGILWHEVGHIVLEHTKNDRFLSSLAGLKLQLAEPRNLQQEYEAWFYAECLRGLVFAEIGGREAPDTVPSYT